MKVIQHGEARLLRRLRRALVVKAQETPVPEGWDPETTFIVEPGWDSGYGYSFRFNGSPKGRQAVVTLWGDVFRVRTGASDQFSYPSNTPTTWTQAHYVSVQALDDLVEGLWAYLTEQSPTPVPEDVDE